MRKRKLKLLFVGLFSALFAVNPVKSLSNKEIRDYDSNGEKCFNETSHLVSVGIGLGRNYYISLSGTSWKSPNFSLTYEFPWPKRIGPGYLGVGGYLGYQTEHDRSYYGSSYYYQHDWNYYTIAGRGTYHWDVLNSEKAEVYGGSLIGLRFQTYHYVTNNMGSGADVYRYNEKDIPYPVFSLFAGARWYFTKNIAVYGEVSHRVSYIAGGLTYKF